MKKTIRDAIDYLETLSMMEEKLRQASDFIGANNISNGLNKNDCMFAASVLEKEMGRVYNIGIEM